MNMQPEENLLKWYLLGATSPDEDEWIEQNLRDEESWRLELLLLEDELIDDYARGVLSINECQLFEKNFLDGPERRRKLLIAQAALKYASIHGPADAPADVPVDVDVNDMKEPIQATGEKQIDSKPLGLIDDQRSQWKWLIAPAWKPALLSVLLLAAGFVGWRIVQEKLEIMRGMVALNQAYSAIRPFEARITALNYAAFSPQRGGEKVASEEDKKARLAGDLAERILLDAVMKRPSVEAHHALGRSYLMKKEFDKAIDQLEEALKSDPKNPRLNCDLGAALLEKAKFQRLSGLPGSGEAMFAQSLNYLNKAVELDGSLLEARFNRALLFQSMGLPQQAIEDWKKYLERETSSRWAEEARRNLKTLEQQNKKISTNKEELYQVFLESWRAKNEEKAWEALRRCYFRDGNYITDHLIDGFLELSLKGNQIEASNNLQALNYAGYLFKRKGDDSFIENIARFYSKVTEKQILPLTQARKHAVAGYEFYLNSRNDRAIAAYSQAKLLFEQSGHSDEALFMGFWIGNCYIQIPDLKRSQLAFTQVASTSKEKRFHWLHAAALNGLTNTYQWLNEYSKAMESCQLARQLSIRVGDDNGILRGLIQLAGLYNSLGKYNESLGEVQQGLMLSSQISAEASQTVSLYSIGAWTYNALGIYAAALDYEKEAVRLGNEMNNPLVTSRRYVHLGLIYAKLEKYDEAIKSIEHGLEIGMSLQPEAIAQEMVNYARLYLGYVYRRAGMFAESTTVLSQAVEFYTRKKTDALRYRALKEKLLTHIAQGDVVTAREELPYTIQLFEKHRVKILEESNRNSFFDVEQTIYDVAINFAFSQLKDPLQALAYSELSRARSLLDAVKIRGQLIDTDETPDVKFPGTSQPISPVEIQGGLPEKSQILEYAILEDKLIIWLISKSKLEGRVVSISSKELTEKLTLYLSQISTPREQVLPLARAAAGDLYDILVRPVEGMLDKNKLICIVPDKVLYRLPFETLLSRESGKYLLEDYSIIYSSSSNLFIFCSEKARQKSGARPEELLSVGNPQFDRQRFPGLADLPSAASEAMSIADYYPKHFVYVNERAVKSAIMQGLKNSDVVHLALHYVPHPQAPMLSQIPLANDKTGMPGARENSGVLTAYEIYHQQITKTRLIVLAGCQTGIETLFKGEGSVGLSRPFIAAGIPLIIASLWPVEDSRATTELMVNFHKTRKSEGLSTVESLRKAKLHLLEGPDKKYRHPFYWAPFTITGGYSEF